MAEVKPPWLPDIKEYQPGEQVFPNLEHQTAVMRGSWAIDVLRRKIIPYLSSSRKLNLLVVGVGLNDLHFRCPYEPYRIAGFLESEKIDYSMAIVDKNDQVINDLRRRKKILLPLNDYRNRANSRKAWKEYLAYIGENSNVTHNLDEDVKFVDRLQGMELSEAQQELREGLLTASVPMSFREKLTNGQIQLIKSDIAKTGLKRLNQFNFIACTNVLYLLSEAGQKLALFNMAQALPDKAIMLINSRRGADIPPRYERRKYTGAALLPEYDGWLTTEKLEELGLKRDEVLENNRNDEIITLTLRKTN